MKQSPLLDEPQRALTHGAFKYLTVVYAEGRLVVAVFGMEMRWMFMSFFGPPAPVCTP